MLSAMVAAVSFNFAPFLFGAFVAAIIVAGTLAARHQYRKARENLERLAAQLGLEAVAEPPKPIVGAPPPRLRGRLRGRAVGVSSYTTGSGKHRTTWCAISAETAGSGRLMLSVSEENLLTRVGHALGMNDVATGDEAFDRRFYVKSSDPGYVRAALIPEVRAKFAQSWKASPSGRIETKGRDAVYAEIGSFADAALCARIAGMAELVCDVAEIAEAHRG
jgi:hypothetical protein